MAELEYLLKNRMRTAILLLMTTSMFAQPKVIVPSGAAKPVGPYSPGLDAGGFVWASGQGALDSAGKMPAGIEAQTRQCLENVKAILSAGSVTMEHVVASQVYMLDLANQAAIDKVYNEYFTHNPPARVTLGVSRMPVGTTVEITVVAVKDLARKKPVAGGIEAGGLLFLNAVYGASPDDAMGKLKSALKGSGHSAKDLVYVNTYVTGASQPGQIPAVLPSGAQAGLFAIAHKGAKKRAGECAVAGNIAFCQVRAASGAAPVEDQTAAVFDETSKGLAGAGFSLANAVATNVYLGNIDEFQKMNAKYASYFSSAPPTRTTVQPGPAGSGPGFRLSVIAVK
ncbi:MAG: hypothetical protein IT161_08110 [Bryobacterales bacterium]|nr:hypothetical protein [Bryobacterales bacterium]